MIRGIKKIKVMHSMLSKMIGLRFHRKITDTAYLFPFDRPIKVSLDMFFVHFPIDVVFLDENKKIVEIKENFLPYSYYRSRNMVTYVLELPLGYVNKNNLEVGQMLTI